MFARIMLHTTAKRLCTFFITSVVATTAYCGEKPDFNRDVLPLLSQNCFTCHGPDENVREAGLRLDQQESALAELESGAIAVVPNKSAESELIARIKSNDADLHSQWTRLPRAWYGLGLGNCMETPQS